MLQFVYRLTQKTIQRPLSRFRSTKNCPPPSSTPGHKDGGYKIYKNLTFFVGLPAILAVAALTYIDKTTHCEERLPFVPYEFLRRRTKRFPWGDGSKSLFHNKIRNALPEGYEEDFVCPGTECEEEGGDGS